MTDLRAAYNTNVQVYNTLWTKVHDFRALSAYFTQFNNYEERLFHANVKLQQLQQQVDTADDQMLDILNAEAHKLRSKHTLPPILRAVNTFEDLYASMLRIWTLEAKKKYAIPCHEALKRMYPEYYTNDSTVHQINYTPSDAEFDGLVDSCDSLQSMCITRSEGVREERSELVEQYSNLRFAEFRIRRLKAILASYPSQLAYIQAPEKSG